MIYPDIFSHYPPLAAKDSKGKVGCLVMKCARCSTTGRKSVANCATAATREKDTGHGALSLGLKFNTEGIMR